MVKIANHPLCDDLPTYSQLVCYHLRNTSFKPEPECHICDTRMTQITQQQWRQQRTAVYLGQGRRKQQERITPPNPVCTTAVGIMLGPTYISMYKPPSFMAKHQCHVLQLYVTGWLLEMLWSSFIIYTKVVTEYFRFEFRTQLHPIPQSILKDDPSGQDWSLVRPIFKMVLSCSLLCRACQDLRV